MSTLRKRIEKLEKLIPPIVDPDAEWGELAAVRDDYLRDQAQEYGEAYAADLKKQLMHNGAIAFRMEAIRAFLKIHGIEEGANDSLASTMARAAGIETSELMTCMRDGRFAQAVIDNVEKAKIAADNGS
jgi:hypothetical protein